VQIPGYNLDIEHAIDKIRTEKYSHIVLQLPEGLKSHVSQIVTFIEEQTTATVYVVAQPCFGACDVFIPSCYPGPVDAIMHMGHTKMLPDDEQMVPVFYITAQSTIDVLPVVEKTLSVFKGNTIGIVTTAQHVHMLTQVENLLKTNGFSPRIGKGDHRITEPGQILGCNFSAATSIADYVDCFLFLGSGTFHALGLVLATQKPVIAADPYTHTIQKDDLETFKESILRQRYGAIAQAKQARSYGILIGKKTGQYRFDLAHQLRNTLKDHGKDTMMFLVDHLSPEMMQSFRHLDCLVSTLCPRLAMDDYLRYDVPIITPVECEIALGVKKWDDYTFDEIIS